MWADSRVLAQLQLFPDLASKEGGQIDALYWFINVVSIVMTLVIFIAVGFFAYKYRRRVNVHATQIEGSTKLELTWSILPFLVMLIMFVGLGIWQLQRRVEKHALMAALTERLAAAPVPLPASSAWGTLSARQDEFRRVSFTATYLSRLDAMVYSSGSAVRDDISGPGT